MRCAGWFNSIHQKIHKIKEDGVSETVSKVILLDGGEGKGETGWLDSTPLGCRDNSFCHHRAS